MNTQSQQISTRRQVVSYLCWTFAISWSAWFLKSFLIQTQLIASKDVTALLLHKIGDLAPTIAALGVLKKSFKDSLAFLFSPGKKGDGNTC